MTLYESARNALEAAHSFIQEEMIVPRVPDDGDFKNRDSHMRKYLMTIETVEHAIRRLASEIDPEKEMCLVGEYREDPLPCPCCGGKPEARWDYDGYYDSFFIIECNSCSCRVKASTWEQCLDEWEGHRPKL